MRPSRFFLTITSCSLTGRATGTIWDNLGQSGTIWDNLGQSGVQLLEFDTSGEIVWFWSDSSRISSLQGVLVLDGLDTDLLHDERTGQFVPSRQIE